VRLKKTLIISLLILAFLPAIQKEFKIIPLSPLNGASISKEKSNFEIQSWFDGSFQQNFDSWLEENIGFRNWFVRLFNQIDFSLFNKLHAAKVVIGKISKQKSIIKVMII